MLKSEMNKLYRKLITLAILVGCLGFVASAGRTLRTDCGDDRCISEFNTCRELYCDGQNCQPCVDQYNSCTNGCPMPEGPPQV
jgi:hypothetical protein